MRKASKGMADELFPRQDLLSYLLDRHVIHGDSSTRPKIAIDRLELHLGQSSGVSLTPTRVHALSTIRRRPPIYLLPPAPPSLVNRSAELETLRQSVIGRHVVDLHGPDGTGKSTLAAALAHESDLNHFLDGAVFVTGHVRYQDLLQALFDSFYESDTPVKITLDQTQTYLGSLRLLIILDDVGLGPKQIDPVLDALREAAVLIVGPERTALGRGRALRLKGLQRKDAVALFSDACSSTPTPEESLFVDQICLLLNDIPLSISVVAAQMAQSSQTLSKLLSELQERKPWAGAGADLSVGPSLEQIISTLDATDRYLLSLVAAFAGPGVSGEAIRRTMDLSAADFQKRVERLEEMKLLYVDGPTEWAFEPASPGITPLRLILVSGFRQTVKKWLVDDAVRREVVGYYSNRLSKGDRLPGTELPGLLGAIGDCAHYGWLDHLKALVTAADRSLAELRWWAEWEHILDLTRRSAQAQGDRALEAWAMHQLGSMLGALSDYERALHLLRTAESMRQALDDTAGAALSSRNLEILEPLAPAMIVEQAPTRSAAGEPPQELEEQPVELPSEEAIEPSEPTRRGLRRLRLGLAILTAIAVLLAAALALGSIYGHKDELPSLTVSWEFGDAWNALDNTTWTQQLKIVTEDGDGDYRYFVDGEPSEETFEVVLPLCDGASGTIQVETASGQSATVGFEFDSPYCR